MGERVRFENDQKDALSSKNLKDLKQSLSLEVPEKIHNTLKAEYQLEKENSKTNLIKNVNNKVLLDVLAPEISANEKAKRRHKYILITLLTIFLIVQFISVCILSSRVIDYAMMGKANYKIVKSLLTFVSAYITSVVVELIAILRYIVKNVFDTSISQLLELFKETPDEN